MAVAASHLGRCSGTFTEACFQGYHVGLFISRFIVYKMDNGALHGIMAVQLDTYDQQQQVQCQEAQDEGKCDWVLMKAASTLHHPN